MAIHDPRRLQARFVASLEFDAFDIWRTSLAPMFFEATLTDPSAAPIFRGSIDGFHLGESAVFRSTCSGLRNVRDARFLRRSNIDHFMIEYQINGRRRGDFSGRNVDIHPGDVSILDFGQTLDSIEPDFARVSLLIPRSRLPKSLLGKNLHGIVLKPESAGPLGPYLAALANAAVDPAHTEGAIDLVLTLLQRALGESVAILPSSDGEFLKLVKAHIAHAAGDTGLTPARVAADFGISRAALYRLFAEEGGVMSYLLAQRLDRCFAALVKSGEPGVGAIAFEHGFNSEAHFSRAFRARYGITARDVRALMRNSSRGRELVGNPIDALALSHAWIRNL